MTGGAPARQETSGFAVASLVLGIVGLTLVPLLASIAVALIGFALLLLPHVLLSL